MISLTMCRVVEQSREEEALLVQEVNLLADLFTSLRAGLLADLLADWVAF